MNEFVYQAMFNQSSKRLKNAPRKSQRRLKWFSLESMMLSSSFHPPHRLSVHKCYPDSVIRKRTPKMSASFSLFVFTGSKEQLVHHSYWQIQRSSINIRISWETELINPHMAYFAYSNVSGASQPTLFVVKMLINPNSRSHIYILMAFFACILLFLTVCSHIINICCYLL